MTKVSTGHRRKRGLSPEIRVAIDPSQEGTPLHTRLYRQLREHILAGTLGRGARLPSARTLAADLRLSRNTVESAFDQLVAEGFVVRRVGFGSTVAESLSDAMPFARSRRVDSLRPTKAPPRPESPARYRPSVVERLGLGGLLGPAGRMVARHLERHPARSALTCLGIAAATGVLVLGTFPRRRATIDGVDTALTVGSR